MLIPQLALAQTEVSGTQSGVWTEADSPYLATGEIVVPSGQTLTIEPGVEIVFQGHYKFTVNGNLQAIGAADGGILFTAANHATGWGGIRISSSVISNLAYCRIEYGKTGGAYPNNHGGGMALLSSDAIVSNCVFADNDATGNSDGMGGAVYAINTGSAAGPLTRFIDCKFIGNHAYGEGGAIKFTGDLNTEITGCEFIGNDCNYGGGAISFYGVTDTKMTGCLFTDNYTMYSNGGAMNTLGFGNTIYLINCTLSGNTAVTGDGGAVNLAWGSGYFVNSIVFDNHGMYSDNVYLDMGGDAGMYYCNLTMPYGASGNNNIDEDPLFVDAANLDYQLTEDSPCIDTATDYFFLNGKVLVDLSPEQYHGSAPDMGAFEYSPATAVSAASATACRLYQNYPNPFAKSTAINYHLAEESYVTAKVFDVSGRGVRTLIDANQAAGGKSVVWNGLNNSGGKLSPGIYFLRLRAGDEVSKLRILLTR